MDDGLALRFAGKCHVDTRAERLEFPRKRELVADQDQLARYFTVVDTDVLDQTNVHRVVEVGVKIE